MVMQWIELFPFSNHRFKIQDDDFYKIEILFYFFRIWLSKRGVNEDIIVEIGL